MHIRKVTLQEGEARPGEGSSRKAAVAAGKSRAWQSRGGEKCGAKDVGIIDMETDGSEHDGRGDGEAHSQFLELAKDLLSFQ